MYAVGLAIKLETADTAGTVNTTGADGEFWELFAHTAIVYAVPLIKLLAAYVVAVVALAQAGVAVPAANPYLYPLVVPPPLVQPKDRVVAD